MRWFGQPAPSLFGLITASHFGIWRAPRHGYHGPKDTSVIPVVSFYSQASVRKGFAF
jgi:hypothetical protein